MNARNGGPAFPRPHSWDVSPTGMTPGDRAEALPEQDGMTLRDYFAAAALTGMVANPSVAKWGGDDNAAPHHHDVVTTAYNIADAMLVERTK